MSSLASNRVKRIGMLGFDGVAAIDMTGMLEAFHVANDTERGAPVSRYATQIVGLRGGPFVAESGVRFLPDITIDAAPEFDTIVVPGGSGLQQPQTNAKVAGWLRERVDGTRRMVSICTGLYGLAADGLMDGRRATTHWDHAVDAAQRFPRVTIEPDAIFVKDGPFYSSGGMTAGIDLALALIDEDHGASVALATARRMVVYMQRSGGQQQYSEPLRFETRVGDRLADLVNEMAGHLDQDWTVDEMAERARLGVRHFTRRFRALFDESPAAYLERLRLDEARTRLASGTEGMDGIASAIGFRNSDAFRRAFERRFGVTPSTYRRRFRFDDLSVPARSLSAAA